MLPTNSQSNQVSIAVSYFTGRKSFFFISFLHAFVPLGIGVSVKVQCVATPLHWVLVAEIVDDPAPQLPGGYLQLDAERLPVKPSLEIGLNLRLRHLALLTGLKTQIRADTAVVRGEHQCKNYFYHAYTSFPVIALYKSSAFTPDRTALYSFSFRQLTV